MISVQLSDGVCQLEADCPFEEVKQALVQDHRIYDLKNDGIIWQRIIFNNSGLALAHGRREGTL